MIYDDRLISDFRSSDRAWQAAQYRRETDRYDVISEAEQAYYLYVLARVLYKIQLSNLRLTEGNLEIARMRADAGISGKDEIYRWQAQVDEQRTRLLDNATLVANRRITLNQILGLDQSTRWKPEEAQAAQDTLLFLDGKLDFVLKTPQEYKVLERVSVKIAEENAPEIQYLDKSIEAQEIQVGQRKRSFILPRINANLSYDWNFWQSPGPAPAKTTLDLEGDAFMADVTATLPLLEGTRRIYDLKRQKSILNELNRRRILARELVEKRTNTAMQRLASSHPNIRISRSAADNAGKNLEIVREKYVQGIVGITDLLDAQNTSFSAEQKAQASVYSYLIDLVSYQRALSFFMYDKTPEEIDGFARKVREMMGAQP
jgi:outer membrane protein TolC